MLKRTHCPICNQPGEVIFSRPYSLPEFQPLIGKFGLAASLADKLYEVRHCPATGLYFQTWVMEERELPSWYATAEPEGFLREIGQQKLHSFAHQTEEILVFRQLCAETVPVVLDFGCSWGKWASMALAHGCEVYGVEVNREAANFCARRGIKIVSFEELKSLRFDFINVDQVMEHLSDPLKVAQHLSYSVKPGAFLKISTPNKPHLPRLLTQSQRAGDNRVINRQSLDPLFPLEHVNLFSRHALRELAGKCGLVEYRLPLFKWLGAGQLWNVPRQLNRNLLVPFKRWLRRGTYVWFRKPA